jgi:prolyl-tRNA synthetase
MDGHPGDQRREDGQRALRRCGGHLLHRSHDAGRQGLQAGTSHFLGQNFAKAFDVLFTNKENKQEHVWATSWGVSTRLMGALIMTTATTTAWCLPPKLAPVQVAIVPIAKNGEQLAAIECLCRADDLAALRAKGITVKFDNDDKKKARLEIRRVRIQGLFPCASPSVRATWRTARWKWPGAIPWKSR